MPSIEPIRIIRAATITTSELFFGEIEQWVGEWVGEFWRDQSRAVVVVVVKA